MKVALDTNALYTTRAGMARLVRGLQHGFAEARPPDLELVELSWPVENLSYAQPRRALKTIWREYVWANWVAPREMRRCDLVHHHNAPFVPLIPETRHVVTLPDLALLRHPERYRPWQLRAGRRRLRRVGEAERVICISEFTAREARELLGVPSSRLVVVHLGGRLPGPVEEQPPADLPEEFFLFVGSLEPGKNLALLREIYLQAAPGELPPLVIVGARWVGVPGEGAPPPDWHYLGEVSDARLAALYRAAAALVFPSKYEGFGLPPLEAMHWGCPVICGRVASLPEVVGDAGVYAELTVADFGGAMRRLRRDAAWQRQLRSAGPVQAAKFSWRRCAEETVAVYRDVLR